MKHKAIYLTEADKKFWSLLDSVLTLHDKGYGLPTKHSDLPLSTIQKICADAWAVPESEMVGRVNHRDPLEKERKVSFSCACYWFSNMGCFEVADYIGCTVSLVRNSKFNVYYGIKYQRRFADIYLHIFKTLSKECPGRLDKFLADLTAIDEEKINEVAKKKAQDSDIISLTEKVREQTIESQSLLIKMLEGDVEALNKKIKILEGREKEIIGPSNAVCFDCPFNKRCLMKEQGFSLCPQLMKLNKQKNGNGRYWWNKESCLQKETIKLN